MSSLEKATQVYQDAQRDLSSAIEDRQRLDAQLQENEVVAKEFGVLSADAKVFKLIGPVLVKQDRGEAVSNVDKRIEFIQAEVKRVESRLKELSEESERRKMEIVRLQQEQPGST